MAVEISTDDAMYNASLNAAMDSLVTDMGTIRTALNAVVTILNGLTAWPTSGGGTSACAALATTSD